MKRIITIAILALMTLSVSAVAGPRKKAELKEVTFIVHLHCENCVNKVVENVSFEKGVKDLKVSLENQTVYVKYDVAKTSEETLKKSIESLGYPVSGTVKPGHEHGHEHHGHDHGHDHQGHAH